MTLQDLFTGNFQTSQLLRELAPLLTLAFCSSYAGYFRGWNQGFIRATNLIENNSSNKEENSDV
jgi:hypothetical protein